MPSFATSFFISLFVNEYLLNATQLIKVSKNPNSPPKINICKIRHYKIEKLNNFYAQHIFVRKENVIHYQHRNKPSDLKVRLFQQYLNTAF